MDDYLFDGYRISLCQDEVAFPNTVELIARLNEEPARQVYKRRIQEGEIDFITSSLLRTMDEFITMIKSALDRTSSAFIAHVNHDDIDGLRLIIRARLESVRTVDMEILLTAVDLQINDRMDQVERLVGTRTMDAFSERPEHHHALINVFHRGRAISRPSGCTINSSALLDSEYRHGVHYLEFKVVKGSQVMFGVQEGLGSLTMYPGGGEYASRGVSIFGHNGHYYMNGIHTDYGMGVYGLDDYVGVLLNMDAHTVRFAINGRRGNAIALTGTAYYIVVTIQSMGDMIKICPAYSYHE
eukprot:TRINITY_DN5417_c0_g1_i2.p1 TRINITY_DN5417_c0_g1~~TRINITY_DN5417_c0_g1_i2.p1  ORF type:complete len:298 (-),score=31.59 TRINITY_DN5417_c0_g1_i2:1046-1939(-)